MNKGVGLDIGTNMLVSAVMSEEGKPFYKRQRDAFFRIQPKSEVNRKSIRMALESRKSNFIIEDGDFIVVGEDALLMANERNADARRPMSKGVLSPKEKDSLPMIKLIIESIIGRQAEGGVPLIFSVPAEPVDGEFDIFFHTEMMKQYLAAMGYTASPMNEAFAIAYSELLDDHLTGLCLSFGAGMVNCAVCYEGDPVVEFSIIRGGDWIDASVGKAIDERASMIQIEKEEGNIDIMKPAGKIQEAISVYYNVLINYTLDNIAYELSKVKLPSFRKDMIVVVSGGLVMAGSFVEKFTEVINTKKLPFKIKEVRKAEDPMTCVARGCLLGTL